MRVFDPEFAINQKDGQLRRIGSHLLYDSDGGDYQLGIAGH